MLLTETYKQLNRQLHSEDPDFGISGQKWAQRVSLLSQTMNTRSILDYGCGRRTLEKALGFPIRNYDPCIPGLDEKPEPADIVACTDVLEHIEPECLDAVLDDLRRVTRRAGFFAVDTRPARKILADGRNAHLIQKPAEWWFPKLYERWSAVEMLDLIIDSKTSPGVIKTLGFTALVRLPRKVKPTQGTGWQPTAAR